MKRLSEWSWQAHKFAIVGLVVGLCFACSQPGLAMSEPETVDRDSEAAPDPEEVRRFLEQLTFDAESLEAIDQAVLAWVRTCFAERYLASVYLARLPVLPRKRRRRRWSGRRSTSA